MAKLLNNSSIVLFSTLPKMAELTVLHYNDVYNVDVTTSKEPIGGAARFVTALKTFDSLKPLILFSGDVFSPSMRKYLIEFNEKIT